MTSRNLTAVARLKSMGRRGIVRLALALSIFLAGRSLVAQVADATSPVPATHRRHQHAAIAIDDRVRVLAKNLELSDEQRSAVRKILEQRHQATLLIRLDRSLSGEARFQRFRALQDNTVLRIRATLTEEQKKKYDPLAVRRLPSDPQQRSVEDWLKVTTPH